MKRVNISAPLWAWVAMLVLLAALIVGTALTAAKVDTLTDANGCLIQAYACEAVTAAQSDENGEVDIFIETTETALKSDISESEWKQIPLGLVEITHYCSCEICCPGSSDGVTASGAVCAEGRTIACDFLPFGTVVNIGGNFYTVEDRIGDGSGNHIDIYVADHERAKQAGRYQTECYVVVFGGDE